LFLDILGRGRRAILVEQSGRKNGFAGANVGDLAQVESRFDSLIPGSAWCGYGTCDAEGAQRLLIFVNLGEQRAMTITRFSDASHDLTGEDGAVWPDAPLDGILNWLAKIGSTAE